METIRLKNYIRLYINFRDFRRYWSFLQQPFSRMFNVGENTNIGEEYVLLIPSLTLHNPSPISCYFHLYKTALPNRYFYWLV